MTAQKRSPKIDTSQVVYAKEKLNPLQRCDRWHYQNGKWRQAHLWSLTPSTGVFRCIKCNEYRSCVECGHTVAGIKNLDRCYEHKQPLGYGALSRDPSKGKICNPKRPAIARKKTEPVVTLNTQAQLF